MASQGALFETILEPPALEPRGFRYQDDIFDEEEESALISSLSKLDLKPFQFHGHVGNRRVASFGLIYDYNRGSIREADAIPCFLKDLLPRVASFSTRLPDEFRQVGVNEYRAGAGIGWHKDKPQFGIIVGVSLSAAATIRFRRATGNGWQRRSHIIKPRSIYILDSDARSRWEHSIPPVDALRYSITFRTLAEAKPFD